MKGVEIHDHDGRTLSFDLAQILEALGSEVDELEWECKGIESHGVAAAGLHALADKGHRCLGTELRRISQGLLQTIDGEFRGHDTADRLVVLIQAVDSTLWEVFASEPLLDRVRKHFSDVRPAGYDAH